MAAPMPRYFVARGEPVAALSVEPRAARHLLDVIRLGEEDTLVVCDRAGVMGLLPAARRSELGPEVQAALAAQALLGPARQLRANPLWLLGVTRLERTPDVAGANDPLFLEGTLVGPLPGEATATAGRLAVTRADLLDAAARGARDACHCGTPGARGVASRWYHLMLAGEDEPDIREGRGVVLAYPLPAADLELGGAGNEALVAALLRDVLEALHADAAFAALRGGAAPQLPVASREPMEEELRARGFTIEGDEAVRRGSGWFGRWRKEYVPLPVEGSVDDFLRLAREALALLGGWHTPRARALGARVPLAEASWVQGEDRGLRLYAGRMYKDEVSLSLVKGIITQVSFAVDEAFTDGHDGPAELELEYQLTAAASLEVVYPSKGGQSRARGDLPYEGGYHELTLPLSKLRFQPPGPDSNLIALEAKGEGSLWIRKLVLR